MLTVGHFVIFVADNVNSLFSLNQMKITSLSTVLSTWFSHGNTVQSILWQAYIFSKHFKPRSRWSIAYDTMVLNGVLTDESEVGLIGLTWSHSFQHVTPHLPLLCFWSVQFLKTNISQVSVATPFGCGRTGGDCFIANFLLSISVKGFSKSVNIWQRHAQWWATN